MQSTSEQLCKRGKQNFPLELWRGRPLCPEPYYSKRSHCHDQEVCPFAGMPPEISMHLHVAGTRFELHVPSVGRRFSHFSEEGTKVAKPGEAGLASTPPLFRTLRQAVLGKC